MSSEEAAVLATVETMVATFQKGDIDGVMQTYVARPNIAFQAGEGVTDPDAIRQMFAQFAQMKPVYRFGGHEVLLAGDLALHITPWSMRASTPDGPIEDQGLSVAVLRKQADGRWKLVIDNPYGDRLLERVWKHRR